MRRQVVVERDQPLGVIRPDGSEAVVEIAMSDTTSRSSSAG